MPDNERPAESSPAAQSSIVKFITTHALERWMERTECRNKTAARASLKRHIAKATEVELAPNYKAIALLNHDLKPARYFKFDKWIFVVSEQGGLLTIHSGAAKRWIPLGSKPPRKKRKKRPPR